MMSRQDRWKASTQINEDSTAMRTYIQNKNASNVIYRILSNNVSVWMDSRSQHLISIIQMSITTNYIGDVSAYMLLT